MGAMSRNKGSAYEREVATALFDELGIAFERDLDQVRKAAHGDLIPADGSAFPFTIECKRRAADLGEIVAWRNQAAAAARSAGNHPAVFYRFDRRQTRVSVPLSALCDEWPDDLWADLTLAGFCLIAREKLADMLASPWKPIGTVSQQLVENAKEKARQRSSAAGQ